MRHRVARRRARTAGAGLSLSRDPQRPDSEGSPDDLLGTAFSTSVRGNATAFGFSIMITACFGALGRIEGQPSVLEILLFGAGGTIGVALLEAIVTRGFRLRPGQAPPEVRVLGTAQGVVSVGAAVGTAIGLAELLGGPAAWIVATLGASIAFLLTESGQIAVAARFLRRRGDPDAERESA